MKAAFYRTKIVVASVALFAPLAIIGPSQQCSAEEKASPSQTRIGIYDSRAVAVAYVGSAFQQAKMKDLVAQSKQAKDKGDSKKVAQLEAEGQAWQANLKKQGFGTAPVEDLLGHISGDLPRIQAEAGVTRLVSRWNKSDLAQHPKAIQIDVTMQLVDAFHPSSTQRQRAIEIQKIRPVQVLP